MAFMLLLAMVMGVATIGVEPAPKAAEPAKVDKPICKSTLRTGTRFPTKTCKTAAQWEEMTEQNRRDAGEMVNRPSLGRPGD